RLCPTGSASSCHPVRLGDFPVDPLLPGLPTGKHVPRRARVLRVGSVSVGVGGGNHVCRRRAVAATDRGVTSKGRPSLVVAGVISTGREPAAPPKASPNVLKCRPVKNTAETNRTSEWYRDEAPGYSVAVCFC